MVWAKQADTRTAGPLNPFNLRPVSRVELFVLGFA
jgi:hypothetical protein